MPRLVHSKRISVRLVQRVKVTRRRQGYLECALQGVERDLPRGEPPVKVDVAKRIELITQSAPETVTHWGARTMATMLNVPLSTVMCHQQAHGLKPHIVRGFKVSRGSKFAEKPQDIVGPYLSPSERAPVLCCDEKSQVKALARMQPGRALKTGQARAMVDACKRNGIPTLFGVITVLGAEIIIQCQPRHPHVRWLKFLCQLERKTVAPGPNTALGLLKFHAE